ncbi:MAG: ABC1 kinase family protein [Acidobacteriota bacterium]
MSDDAPLTAPLRRLLKLGGLVGRVGASVATQAAIGFAGPASAREARRRETLAKNAARIVSTLGELKGAAMKVGQMLSLHEGLLPHEVTEALRALQREAPRIPFEVVAYELDSALPEWRKVFRHLEPEAFAAASIGQVHRGELHDGRAVAVKVQYPLIDRILEADLGNLRLLLETLFALVSAADFEPIWLEVRDRLREEVDYQREAATIERARSLYAGDESVVIPALVPEASARRVLTTEYEGGLAPDAACSPAADQALRDRWGQVLFGFVLRGLFEHRSVHADPNLSNFAFRRDGRVVVYDWGCVKEVPDAVASGYARLARAALAGEVEAVPGVLRDLGVFRDEGEALEAAVVRPYVELFGGVFRAAPPYRFGEDETFYPRLVELGWSNASDVSSLQLPHDVVFIDRALAGLFGNLVRLRASGPWRERLLALAAQAPVPAPSALPPRAPARRRRVRLPLRRAKKG